MIFRTIEKSDTRIQDVEKLYINCFNEPDKGENWTQESSYRYFQDRIKEGSSFYAIYSSTEELMSIIVGGPLEKSFLVKELSLNFDNSFYISLIAVSKDHRRKSLAQKNLDYITREIKDKGYQSFSIRCRSSNSPVQGLLIKNGFSEYLKYTSELGGVTCERIIMTKNL